MYEGNKKQDFKNNYNTTNYKKGKTKNIYIYTQKEVLFI